MKYVETIVPLPLDGLFTYAVPNNLSAQVAPGMRVQVPFGKTKTHTAVVLNIHERKPDFEVKPIICILDDKPVLLPAQLDMWKWISHYYMAPIGDVYTAALPAGLKAEDGYRPRTEDYIALCPELRNSKALHVALQSLTRAKKQQQVFCTYLHMSHWDVAADGEQTAIREITREELRNATHATEPIIKALIDRRLLYIYKVEVGRLNNADEAPVTLPKALSEAQAKAYNETLESMKTHEVTLLHGVTSSGKQKYTSI